MLHAHQKIEGALFGGAGKSVERYRVLAHHLPNFERDPLARRCEPVVSAERDQYFITDSAGLDDNSISVANRQRACQRGDHCGVSLGFRGRVAAGRDATRSIASTRLGKRPRPRWQSAIASASDASSASSIAASSRSILRTI